MIHGDECCCCRCVHHKVVIKAFCLVPLLTYCAGSGSKLDRQAHHQHRALVDISYPQDGWTWFGGISGGLFHSLKGWSCRRPSSSCCKKIIIYMFLARPQLSLGSLHHHMHGAQQSEKKLPVSRTTILARCQSPKYENGFQHCRHLVSGWAMNTNDEN